MKRNKTIWCYLDGKKHCDVVQWALTANVTVRDAKQMLTDQYPNHGDAADCGIPSRSSGL